MITFSDCVWNNALLPQLKCFTCDFIKGEVKKITIDFRRREIKRSEQVEIIDYRCLLFILKTLSIPLVSISSYAYIKSSKVFIFRLLLFCPPHGFMLYALFFALLPIDKTCTHTTPTRIYIQHSFTAAFFWKLLPLFSTLKILCVIFTFSYFISFSRFSPPSSALSLFLAMDVIKRVERVWMNKISDQAF